MTNFQPISNLPFLSKIVEKYVSMQLTQNLEAFILFYIQTTIGVLQVSLHRVCYHPHSSWHFWIFWLGAHNSPRLSGRACGLWHCWPWFPFFPITLKDHLVLAITLFCALRQWFCVPRGLTGPWPQQGSIDSYDPNLCLLNGFIKPIPFYSFTLLLFFNSKKGAIHQKNHILRLLMAQPKL